MKKFIMIIAVMLACVSFGADANQMKYISILPSITTTNPTATGATIDIQAYKGNASLVVYGGTASATNNTMTVTFQHSTASNFANPTTVTNLAGTAGVITLPVLSALTDGAIISTFAIDTARLHRYVRVTLSQTLADNYIPVSVMLVAPMKSE